MRWLLLLACCTPAKEPERTVVIVATPDAAPVATVAVATTLAPDPPLQPKEIALHDVFEPAVGVKFRFAKGSVTVPSDFGPGLDLVARSLKDWPRKASVEGNSQIGEPVFLALKRATVITNELVKRGVPASDLAPRAGHDGSTRVELLDGDEPLALRRKFFDTCCNNFGSSDLLFTIDNGRPDSKAGREIYDRDKARCAECNGNWGPQGMAGFPGCACKFADGGKPCSQPKDCKGMCEVGYENALRWSNASCAPNAPCPIQGACQQINEHFGCHGWVEEDPRGLRKTNWICVD